jgi:hypothetical protein
MKLVMRLLIKAMFLGILLASTASQAATVNFKDGFPTTAESITNLGIDVEGTGALTFYDVMFVYVTGTGSDPITAVPCTGPDVYCDVFVADDTGGQAQRAAQAIAALLTMEDATRVGGDGPTPSGEIDYVVSYLYDVPPSTCADICTYRGVFDEGDLGNPNDDSWGTFFSQVDEGTEQNTTVIEFARFKPAAPVPLPPAIYLFGSGLAVLLGVKRRGRGGIAAPREGAT